MSNDETTSATAYSRLLSLAVHELRTPVSVVSGYLRMLQRDSDSPLSERQRRMVEEAEKACARIVALVTELSEISKLDAGSAVATEESFDLLGMLEEVAADVHEASDRGVRLELRGERSGAPVQGDLTRLRAAFTAIFRAVLREQPTAGTVVVERRLEMIDGRNATVIAVAREKAVQNAYAAPRAPFNDKRGGLGLQLPIAVRVVERHGGSIWSPALPDEPSQGGPVVVAFPLPITAERQP